MADTQLVFEIPPSFYLYEDGSVKRGELRPPLPESPQDGVSFKEVTLHEELGLWARLYLPQPSPPKKLPLVLFFHGGGFILGSPASCHPFCTALAKHSGAILLSASYRLGPEHRLPRAYDDGITALQWLHSQSLLLAEGREEQMDPWLAAHADFSNCFVAGESAGGNLAHRVVMLALNKASSSSPNAWAPLSIRGLIPIHPGFARETRTQAEEESPFDPLLDWRVADMTFELSLPLGTNKDHRFANPLVELTAGAFNQLPPKALVALADGDRLHFMGLEYAQALRKAGVSADVFMNEGVGHCFYALQPSSEAANLLYARIAKFISEECFLQGVAKFVKKKVCCN